MEIAITGEHAMAVRQSPSIHKDPSDRMLVSRAIQQGLAPLTSNAVLARSPGPVRLV